jgi:hypothetical protein
VGVSYVVSNYGVLGVTFLRNFYAQFDFVNNQVSMAANNGNLWNGGTGKTGTGGNLPNFDGNNKISTVAMVFIALGGCLLILMILFCCSRVRATPAGASTPSTTGTKTKEEKVDEEDHNMRPMLIN